MKHFFWLSAAAYIVLYFYAAWIYEGFSMTLAILIFLVVSGLIYWRHKRKIAIQAERSENFEPHQPIPINTKPLSLWRSPLPYIGLVAVVIVVFWTQL